MHLCYGIGALISPLIAEPFLINADCSLMIKANRTNTTLVDVSNSTLVSLDEASKATRVFQAYWIMAALQVGEGDY